jgi:F0F1-type ATP synthase alpha subunit
MVSGAVIYIPSFIKIGSGVQKLIVGDTQTAT